VVKFPHYFPMFGKKGGPNEKPDKPKGRGRPLGPAPVPKFRPHLGEFPKITLPMGADGVRITHLNGVTYAEYHFPHNHADCWIPAHHLHTEQERSFDRHLAASAASIGLSEGLLSDGTLYAGDKVPDEVKKVVLPSARWADQVEGNPLSPTLGTQWWKSHLKPSVWRRIFPAAAGTAGPSSE
jgi:hypothetical protein